MPFVIRKIEPVFLSRKSLFDEAGKTIVNDYELEAVTNNTLSNVLRQLASLVLVANDIFAELAVQLKDISDRSQKLRIKIQTVEDKLILYDPKTVPVPEADICTFSKQTFHFKSSNTVSNCYNLFTVTTRSKALQKLYDRAVPTPVHHIRQLDKFRRDGTRSSKYFVCTPVLGGKRRKFNRKVDIDIETRKPSAVEDLRRWTSAEALGDITVLPDNVSKITTNETSQRVETDKDEVDHLLPSPEEQMQVLALRFPPSIVTVDVSGKTFNRMHNMRRSLITAELTSDATSRRRRSRKHRGKRRNTIAGTSEKEIQQAIAGETTTEVEDNTDIEPLSTVLSRSSDFLRPLKVTSPADNIKNHFNTLKNWSRSKLRLTSKTSPENQSSRPSFQATDVVDDINIYETINTKRRRTDRLRSATLTNTAAAISLAVKLRENSLQRRNRRAGKEEQPHSSSGNWSASSESGRTSIASETTVPPKSSTTNSSNSLNHHFGPPPSSGQSRRRYFHNTSTSSSISEGTLTPDINDMHAHDLDGETSSVYSCDTEGYYTSFHLDSGLKTLKEEEAVLSISSLQLPEAAIQSTTALSTSSGRGSQMTAENEYELFGKGSTSTTTSSAGTVCTTLLAGQNGYGSTRSLSQFAPAVPERKSSLDRKTDKKLIRRIEDEYSSATTVVSALIHDSPSPDSGHNTSSSPVEDGHSPHEQSELESDLEGCERIERIRSKTAMTTSRIPSMCVITPPQSDDEMSLRNYNGVPLKNMLKNLPEKDIRLNLKKLQQKPLNILIPSVPVPKIVTDIYALPDKSKKTKNGLLETNLDEVLDKIESGYATLKKEKESEYVSLNELPASKENDSLERKKKGAKVKLDPDGKVIYSSDSLKRTKQHTTFEPGQFVREQSTQSPLPDHRAKNIRPVNLTGLIKTNTIDKCTKQLQKLVIRANAKQDTSNNVVRIKPTRVVSPVTGRSASPKKGPRVVLNNDLRDRSISPNRSQSPNLGRCTSPALSSSSSEQKRSTSPSSSSSSKEDKPAPKWISEHPAVSNGFPRNHPMYWTLPAKKSYSSVMKNNTPSEYGRVAPIKKQTVSSQVTDPYDGLRSAQLVKEVEKTKPLSSTPTKSEQFNLSGFISPIEKTKPRLVSPPKAKMTTEQIFAAIHKSKKRLQLAENPRNVEEGRQRNSWSPEEAKKPKQTSINDFKKLLLQQGSKVTPISKSAVEQLKLSKQSVEEKKEVKPVRVGGKISKNYWRFASPRTNILSSTILEDCSEVEKPEDTMRYRKQLEFGSPKADLVKSPKTANETLQKFQNRSGLKLARFNFFNQSSAKPISPPRTIQTSTKQISPQRIIPTKPISLPRTNPTIQISSSRTLPTSTTQIPHVTRFSTIRDTSLDNKFYSPTKSAFLNQSDLGQSYQFSKRKSPIISLETAL